MIKIISDVKGIIREMAKIVKVPDAAQKAIEKYTQEDVMPLFEATVTTWDHSVEFKRDESFTLDIKSIRVYTDDYVWNLVSEGAKKHTIVPKNAPFLRFQSEFVPKSKVGWIGSQSGGKSGNWVHRKSVDHPGFAAREFEKAIAKEAKPKFKQRFIDEYRAL